MFLSLPVAAFVKWSAPIAGAPMAGAPMAGVPIAGVPIAGALIGGFLDRCVRVEPEPEG